MQKVLAAAASTLLLAVLVLGPTLVFADNQAFNPGTGTGSLVPTCTGPSLGANLGKECTVCDFMHLLQNLLNFVLFAAVVTAGGLIAWAGWRFAVGGSGLVADERNKAKSMLTSAIIGLVLVIGAYTIVSTIMKTLAGGSFMDSWNDICTINTAYSP